EIGAGKRDAERGEPVGEVRGLRRPPGRGEAVQVEHAGRAQLDQPLASGPAPAMDESVAVRVVVVGQLLAPANRTRRAYPDDTAPRVDVHVAIRLARVVDEPRHVAAHAGVDHRAVRQLEAPDVAALDVAPLALQAFTIGDALAGVVNDACVLGDALGRENAPSM